MGSVTTTGFGAAAIEALARILDRWRADGPLAPAVVISPNELMAVEVRRALGARPGGIAGVRFTTMAEQAETLARPAMVGAGAHLGSDVELQAAIRAELALSPGLFAPVMAHRTTEERLVALGHQLAGLDEATLGRIERGSVGLAGEAVGVLRRVRRQAGRTWSQAQLLGAAVDELALLAPGERGPIVIFLPEPADSFEGQMLAALARRSDSHSIVGLSGVPDVDRRHIGRLAGWGIQIDSYQPVELKRATRLEVPDPDDEVRAALRDVVAHGALGVPLNRMAVLYTTADPYASLLSEQLEAARLPWAGPGQRSLVGSLVGRFLIRLLGLGLNGFERSAVITLAASAPLVDIEGRPWPVSLWDRLSRQAGVIDEDHWRPRLQALAPKLAPAEGAEVDRLLQFVEQLQGHFANERQPATWLEWVDWAEGLVAGYLPLDRDWPEEEAAARAQLSAALNGLRILDTYGEKPDLETFESILAAHLQRLTIPGPALGAGLVVAPIGAVAGLDFERVIVVGLAEGAFPRRPRDDALLPDRVRATSGGLVARNETVTDLDIRAVAAALAGARRQPLVIVARGDLRSIRSRSWPRALNALTGEVSTIESHHRALVDHGRPASLDDVALRAMVAHVDGGDLVHTHELAGQDQVLAQNLQRVLNRSRPELNRHVGRVPAGAIDATQRLLSATALEAYASCPRSYLLGRVLRLGEDDRPEQIDEIIPSERGKLLHGVLERFVAESLQADTVPTPQQCWPETARERLFEILDEELAKAQARGVTGGRVSTRILHRRLSTEMKLFLHTDNELRAERGSTPIEAELGFGFDDEPSEVVLPDGRSVRLRGRVDRVDSTDDGGLLIIDYKGGSGRAFTGLEANPLDGGRRMQLPLYARVVADKLDLEGPRTAVYWLTRNGKVKPVELEQDLESDLDRTVGAALDGISGGLFPGVPGETVGWPRLTFANCKYCEFDRICPTDRQREWDNVSGDPVLKPIATLGDMVAGEDR